MGHKVADALAEELVKKIRSYGLMAERGFGLPHGNSKDLMIKGQLLSIDEATAPNVLPSGWAPAGPACRPMCRYTR